MTERKGTWQFAQCLRPCEAYLLYQEDRDKASEKGRGETIVQDEETGKQDLKREIRTKKREVTAAEKQKGRILSFASNLTAVYRLLWIRKNRA